MELMEMMAVVNGTVRNPLSGLIGDDVYELLETHNLLNEKGVPYTEIDVMMKSGLRTEMTERAGGSRKVPQIFVDGEHIGDCEEIQVLEADGLLDVKLGIGG